MSDPWLSPALLTPLLLGGAGALLGLFGLIARPSRWGGLWLALQGLLGVALVALAGLNFSLGYSRSLWAAPALLAGLLVALGPLPLACRNTTARRVFRLVSWRPAQAAVLLAATTSLAAWQTCDADLNPEATRDQDLVFLMPDDLSLREAPGLAACTDGGLPVPLYLPTSQEAEETAQRPEAEALVLANPLLHEKLIRVGPADIFYNCHGWVFTGGRAWVRGEQVPGILRDNGYLPTSEPQEDDLVVYFGSAGEVLHSGIIRVIPPDGPPVVESKWGWAGRFLHPATVASYQGHYHFFHSARGQHLLKGLGGEACPAPASPPRETVTHHDRET